MCLTDYVELDEGHSRDIQERVLLAWAGGGGWHPVRLLVQESVPPFSPSGLDPSLPLFCPSLAIEPPELFQARCSGCGSLKNSTSFPTEQMER